MAITGAHMLLYTSEPDKVRDILKDVFRWSHVDAGDGWLIFRMPPAEIGVHPGEKASHQVTLVCDDLDATMSELASRGVVFEGEKHDAGWGVLVNMLLPGDLKVMLYEARHPVTF